MQLNRICLSLGLVLASALTAWSAHAMEGGCCGGGGAAQTAQGSTDKNKEVIAKQGPAYPLKTCVVSGGDLGAMGGAVDYVYKDRLVRFCCKGCIKKFEKEPDTYLKKIDDAAKKAADEKSSDKKDK
ncbi:MAG TPA: hypothetical protein VGP72_02415 [Planctomycetota bacterium]|jgi:hypothetical protein